MIDDRHIQKWGFGAAPISDRMRLRYDAAVAVGLVIVDIDAPHPITQLAEISELKGMFNRCVKKDQWDWFSVHASLGRPPHTVCRHIVGLLSGYRKALKNEEVEQASELRRQLSRSDLFGCLTAYENNQGDDGSVDYLYVLSTREQPDVLKIGMTERTPEQRIKEINAATGLVYPYSARKLVPLRNASEIERLVHAELAEYRIRRDREFFRIPFAKAAEVIDSVVDEHGIKVRENGVVKTFRADKGFGFLTTPDGTDVFFHLSSWPDRSTAEIVVGTQVLFRIVDTPKGVTARDIEFASHTDG